MEPKSLPFKIIFFTCLIFLSISKYSSAQIDKSINCDKYLFDFVECSTLDTILNAVKNKEYEDETKLINFLSSKCLKERIFAFHYFLNNKNPIVFEYFSKTKESNGIVCSQNVNWEIYKSENKYVFEEIIESDILNNNLKRQFDSLVLYGNFDDELTSQYLKTYYDCNSKDYSLIRNRAINEHKINYLILLAKYKQDGDIEVIDGFIKNSNETKLKLELIKIFPSKSFFYYLDLLLDIEIKNGLKDKKLFEEIICTLKKMPIDFETYIHSKKIRHKKRIIRLQCNG